jgi:hypothetical protein
MLTRYTIFRENFQHDTWEALPHSVMADDSESAVKSAFSGAEPQFGTYAAVPTDDLIVFVSGRTLHRIAPRIETVEPIVTA